MDEKLVKGQRTLDVFNAYREWYAATEWREVGDRTDWDALVSAVRTVEPDDRPRLVDASREALGESAAATVARILSGDDSVESAAAALFDEMFKHDRRVDLLN